MQAALIKVALLAALTKVAQCGDAEHRLYATLLADYDTLERPNANVTSPIKVTLGIVLQQLISVDEKNQIITTNAWLKYVWNDYRLRWDPAANDGTYDLRINMDALWKPDVILYNSVDSAFDSTYPANFVVYSDGTINWIPPGIFMISCKIDITWFPFDQQRCFFKFGSWTYDGTKLDLKPDPELPVDMSEYIVSGQWDLYKVVATRNVKYYDCCPEPYYDVKFHLYLKRRTIFYAFNLVVPCICITVMTIVGFQLPVDCGEKISLQITVVLSIVFFLSILSTMMPATSESVPLLGIFFQVCMIASCLTTAMTVFVVMLHHRTPDSHHMGEVTRKMLMHWLPWLLFMDRPGVLFQRKHLPPLKKIKADSSSKPPAEITLEERISQCCERVAKEGVLESCRRDGKRIYDTAMLVLTQRMFMEIKSITRRYDKSDRHGEMNTDWNYAAMVLDRLSRFVFIGVILFGTCYVFATAPYLTADNVVTDIEVTAYD